MIGAIRRHVARAFAETGYGMAERGDGLSGVRRRYCWRIAALCCWISLKLLGGKQVRVTVKRRELTLDVDQT